MILLNTPSISLPAMSLGGRSPGMASMCGGSTLECRHKAAISTNLESGADKKAIASVQVEIEKGIPLPSLLGCRTRHLGARPKRRPSWIFLVFSPLDASFAASVFHLEGMCCSYKNITIVFHHKKILTCYSYTHKNPLRCDSGVVN